MLRGLRCTGLRMASSQITQRLSYVSLGALTLSMFTVPRRADARRYCDVAPCSCTEPPIRRRTMTRRSQATSRPAALSGKYE